MDSLLRAFAKTFEGQPYLHRRAYTGDFIASHLYEDLLALGRAPKFTQRVEQGTLVVNIANTIKGRTGRRGDGTLGVLTPSAVAVSQEGFRVKRGPVATLEIGSEVKIVATKMTAQIDRVMTDLRNQSSVFATLSKKGIRIGIVGVNFAYGYTGYEGDRQFVARTPPVREAREIVRRLDQYVRSAFDEFLVLRFAATNQAPFRFAWENERETMLEYSSALVRISDEYEARF